MYVLLGFRFPEHAASTVLGPGSGLSGVVGAEGGAEPLGPLGAHWGDGVPASAHAPQTKWDE